MASKYKDVGKKQIINVIENLIRKTEALDITLNLLIQFLDKKEEFTKFMNKQLGGVNGTSDNVQTDRQEDSSDNKEDA